MLAVRRQCAAGLRHGVLLALVVMTLYPVFLMVITSVKDNTEFYENFLWIVPPFHVSNYLAAWQEVRPYLMNSVIVTGLTVVAVVAFSALAAYAFARLRFVGKEVLYYMVIALMMLPYVLTLVPQFILIKNFGLLDTRWALILPYISGGGGFSIFVFRGFFSTPPPGVFWGGYIARASP